MANKYVDFISDEHLLNCVANLHKSYLKAKNNVSKKSFYSNKVDTIKLTFDSKFNNIDEEDLIQSEILRQIDKSINNSIGTFHEQVLGGMQRSPFILMLPNSKIIFRVEPQIDFTDNKTAEDTFKNDVEYPVQYAIDHLYLRTTTKENVFGKEFLYNHDPMFKKVLELENNILTSYKK